jgi:hypothetical protein
MLASCSSRLEYPLGVQRAHPPSLQRAYLFTCQLRLFPVAYSLACLRHHYPTPYSLYTQVSTDIVLLCHLLYPTLYTTWTGSKDTNRHDQVPYPLITTTTSIQSSLRQRDLRLITHRRNRHCNYERRVCLRSSTGHSADYNSVKKLILFIRTIPFT